MNKVIISVYILVSLIIANYIYKDFGISWDEAMQRETAYHNYNYVFKGDQGLINWIDRDYGVVFELPLYILEKVFKWEDLERGESYVFKNRHIVTHLFYIVGGIFLFLLVVQLFNSKIYGVLALFIYMLQPRIYAHSFFNTKDVPLLVGFIICYYFLFRFIKKRNTINAIILGFCSAILINIRILGIVFPVIAIIYLLFFDILYNGISILKSRFKQYIAFCISLLLFTYLLWPILWKAPIDNFIEIFNNMSHFRHNTLELVFGEFIRASEDKTYFFKWFFTTVPFGYLILGITGVVLLLISTFKNNFYFLKKENNRFIALLFFYLIFSLGIIIMRKSVLYNGWRQLFFIYPSFIILIIFVFNFFKKTKIHSLLIIAFVIYSINLSIEQIKLHPYQAIYFNELVSKEKNYIVKNFEFDYWGTSYKEALEKIVLIDDRDSITIKVSEYVGVLNLKILPPKDKKRLHYEENIEDADYFISNFYTDDIKFDKNQLVFQIRRYDNPVISIFKLK